MMSRRHGDLRQRVQQLEVVVLDVVLHVVPEVHCRKKNTITTGIIVVICSGVVRVVQV